MPNSIQKPFFIDMALKFLTVLILLSHGAAMDAPSQEFNAVDLVSLGVFSGVSGSSRPNRAAKSVRGGSVSSLTSSTTQKALLIATPKRGVESAHPSVPFITVDVTQSSTGCGPFDWIFTPDCSPPRLNLVVGPRTINGKNKVVAKSSILYVYNIPTGAENIRITLPNYGSCGLDGENARTGSLRVGTQRNFCNRARFRRRSCRTRFLFIRRCSLRDCDTLIFASRVIVVDSRGTTTIPYIASGGGFETCSTSEIANLFIK